MQDAALKIGVLALQGGFAAHAKNIQKLGHQSVEIRYADQLTACDALVLPGGESTTIAMQADKRGMIEPIIAFSEHKPLFGTCAGVILMAHLKIFDIQVKRNAYGSQVDSFVDTIAFEHHRIPAMFIRAPQIEDVSPEVTVLATHANRPVFINQGLHFGTTFHPELTDDDTLYSYLLQRFSPTNR